jgi:hypothetical protein
VIRIFAPTGAQIVRAQALAANPNSPLEHQLGALCGDAIDELLPLVMDAPAGALHRLVLDITRHFDLELDGRVR